MAETCISQETPEQDIDPDTTAALNAYASLQEQTRQEEISSE